MKIKRLLILVNCLLAGLVLFTGVRLISSKWSLRKAPDVQAAKAGLDESPRWNPPVPQGLEEYRVVIDRDVFNTAKDAAAQSHRAEQEKIRNTSLRVRLKGTIIGQDQRSLAVILDGQTGREDLYGQNDFLQGARILEIQKERVILSIGGTREVLDMDAGKDTPPREPRAKPGTRVSPQARPSRETQRPAGREAPRPMVQPSPLPNREVPSPAAGPEQKG
ncbi:MAG: type II secretion system protein N [Thermodesulfobacteriota bacterium]